MIQLISLRKLAFSVSGKYAILVVALGAFPATLNSGDNIGVVHPMAQFLPVNSMLLHATTERADWRQKICPESSFTSGGVLQALCLQS